MPSLENELDALREQQSRRTNRRLGEGQLRMEGLNNPRIPFLPISSGGFSLRSSCMSCVADRNWVGAIATCQGIDTVGCWKTTPPQRRGPGTRGCTPPPAIWPAGRLP